MHLIPIPIKVMSQIGVDLMHMSKVDDKMFLITAVDYFTKYIEMGALPKKQTTTIALWLYENIFCKLVKQKCNIKNEYTNKDNDFKLQQLI